MKGRTMRAAIAVAAILLAGCVGGAAYRAEAIFDLNLPATPPVDSASVAGVDVVAPLWLGGSAMQYRLLYADPARRFDYSASRWVAPPDELVKHSLERSLGASGSGPCRLRVELAEFAQVFDTPTASRFVLEGRATLIAAQEALASHGFSIDQEAPSADAKGGVAAAGAALQRAERDLATWLTGVGGRCRPGSA